MAQEMTEFAMVVVRLPFRDIARDGNGRTADLVGETVNLTLRETVGQFVSFRDQIHRFLPRDQILKMLRHNSSHFWVLITGNWVLVYFFTGFFLPKPVSTVAPMLASMSLAGWASLPSGSSSKYFWKASAVPSGASILSPFRVALPSKFTPFQ